MCGAEFERVINEMTKDGPCPYCENKKVLAGYNGLKTTRPDIAKEWGIENYPCNGSPERYTLIKNQNILWICSVCSEPYKMPIDDRVIVAKCNHKACPKCEGKLKNNIKCV